MVYFTHEGGKRVFCQVIIDIVHENVASPFTYRIPDGMQLEPGQRVAVPFGLRCQTKPMPSECFSWDTRSALLTARRSFLPPFWALTSKAGFAFAQKTAHTARSPQEKSRFTKNITVERNIHHALFPFNVP